jgi:hypothetical protein
LIDRYSDPASELAGTEVGLVSGVTEAAGVAVEQAASTEISKRALKIIDNDFFIDPPMIM